MLRANAAFAKSEIYEALEERGVKYAIRIPANENLEQDVAELLPRPVGRLRKCFEMGRILVFGPCKDPAGHDRSSGPGEMKKVLRVEATWEYSLRKRDAKRKSWFRPRLQTGE